MQGPVDHSVMVEWVWNYFADAPKNGASSSSTGDRQLPSLASKLTGPIQLSSEPQQAIHTFPCCCMCLDALQAMMRVLLLCIR